MKRFICLLILFIFLTFMYTKYIEPNSLGVSEYSIINHKIPTHFDGFKIVHLSDFLYQDKNNNTLIEKTVKQTNEQKADIIVYTGDLNTKKLNNQEIDYLTKQLKNLNAKLYKYAILGDQDNSQTKEILENSGFIILDNTANYIFNEGNEPILIAGGDNLTKDSLLNDENITYNFKIALIHKPDNFDDIKENFDLVLAGHSLGGQIRLPYIGAIKKKNGAQKYTDKHYKDKESELYISFGTGNEKPYLRFFNKPTINVYRLYSK